MMTHITYTTGATLWYYINSVLLWVASMPEHVYVAAIAVACGLF